MSEKMEEMCETFRRAWRGSHDDPDEAMDAGLRAVIERHVRWMLCDAYRDGYRDHLQKRNADSASSAERIIADLMPANPEDKAHG